MYKNKLIINKFYVIMSIHKLTLVYLLFAIFFIGCGSGSSDMESPEKVAENYLNYVNNKEFDKAKELCTEKTREFLEKFESLGEMEEGAGPGKSIIEDIKCLVEGDKAVCTFTSDGEPQEMLLVKIDGKWMVDFEIDNLIQ